jgi:hypothetical protein
MPLDCPAAVCRGRLTVIRQHGGGRNAGARPSGFPHPAMPHLRALRNVCSLGPRLTAVIIHGICGRFPPRRCAGCGRNVALSRGCLFTLGQPRPPAVPLARCLGYARAAQLVHPFDRSLSDVDRVVYRPTRELVPPGFVFELDVLHGGHRVDVELANEVAVIEVRDPWPCLALRRSRTWSTLPAPSEGEHYKQAADARRRRSVPPALSRTLLGIDAGALFRQTLLVRPPRSRRVSSNSRTSTD